MPPESENLDTSLSHQGTDIYSEIANNATSYVGNLQRDVTKNCAPKLPEPITKPVSVNGIVGIGILVMSLAPWFIRYGVKPDQIPATIFALLITLTGIYLIIRGLVIHRSHVKYNKAIEIYTKETYDERYNDQRIHIVKDEKSTLKFALFAAVVAFLFTLLALSAYVSDIIDMVRAFFR